MASPVIATYRIWTIISSMCRAVAIFHGLLYIMYIPDLNRNAKLSSKNTLSLISDHTRYWYCPFFFLVTLLINETHSFSRHGSLRTNGSAFCRAVICSG
jgi:hypothetical protein